MDRIHIIIDTREQRPWAFLPSVATVSRGTLKTGDYALAGDGDNFAIERKSLDDFLGTISTGWERFKREIERMRCWTAKVIIVESDFEQCCFRELDGKLISPNHNHPMLLPQFVTKRIAELTMQGVAVIFAGNPDYSAGLATAILRERYHGIKSKS